MPHAYATVLDLKARMGVDLIDSSDDADLLRALQAAAEAIDAYCGRTFQPYSGVVYPDLTGVHGRGRLYTPDFLSLTEVAQDDGTGAYGTAWVATDYLAWPYAAPSHQRPYTALERGYAGNYYWPYYPNWLRLTGLFGFWQKLADTGATTAEALDTSETSIEISDMARVSKGMTLKVDSEQMFVTDLDPAATAGGNATMTVERAVNGTTAATHLTSAAIYRYVYPPAVVEATLAHAQTAHGGGMVAAAGGVVRRRAGDLEIEYGTRTAGATGTGQFDFGAWLAGYRRSTVFS